MRFAIGLVMAAIVLGLLAPAAMADDNSVYAAYVSRDADLAKFGKQLKSGLRTWKASNYRRPGKALAALRRGRGALADVTKAMKAEEPSSDDGKRAKSRALASVGLLDRGTALLARAIRARTAGHLRRANRLADKDRALLKRAKKAEREARAAFKAAGVQVKS